MPESTGNAKMRIFVLCGTCVGSARAWRIWMRRSTLNASLFKRGAEPVSMARCNLELAASCVRHCQAQVPEFSIFTMVTWCAGTQRSSREDFQRPIWCRSSFQEGADSIYAITVLGHLLLRNPPN